MVYMGKSKKTGLYSRCRAHDPAHCRFHGDGTHVKYDQKTMEKLNEAIIAKRNEEAGRKNRSLKKTENEDTSSNANEAEEGPVSTQTERITTLLTDRVDLDDDRKGRFPDLDLNGDMTKETRKLGRYLERNFNGDRNEICLKAIQSAYGQPFHRIDPEPGSTYGRSLTAARSSSDDPNTAMYESEDKNQVVIVSGGKRSSRSYKTGYHYKHMNVNIDVLKFQDVLTYQAMSDEMANRLDMSSIGMEQLRKDLIYGNLDEYRWPKTGYTSVIDSLNRISKGINLYKQLTDEGHPIPPLDIKHGQEKLTDDQYKAIEGLYKQMSDDGRLTISSRDPYRQEKLTDDQYKAIRKWADGLVLPKEYEKNSQQLRQYMSYLDQGHNNVREAWSGAVLDISTDEINGQMNRDYARRANSKHSATVYEWKKNRDEEHDEAAAKSSFAKDFKQVEVDNSVDLDKFNKLQKEWKSFNGFLPETNDKPTLRFRKTGRHHATGVYTPAYRNMAVDPRSPSSFTHEYYHHWDFDSLADGHQRSMQPEFREIVSTYRDNLDTSMIVGSKDNYLAPTEVLARAGELYQHWKHPHANSSFLDTDETYEKEFDYQPLLPLKDKIISFFDHNHI